MALKRHQFKIFIGLSAVSLLAFILWFYMVSMPQNEGQIKLPGLVDVVKVDFDVFANPIIKAGSKRDAYFTLGYLTARERMFQMDLMRRKSAGRLSEILGRKTLNLDISNRHLRLNRLASTLVNTLPDNHKRILQSYSDGVNAYLKTLTVLPVEFIALDYFPEPWRIQDSLLISLSMFQLLDDNESNERMITVMKKVLPDPVVSFLTPQDDIYNASVLLQGREDFDDSPDRIPVQSLNKINKINNDHENKIATGLVNSPMVLAGSNQWAVNKTRDGRAILANDMHLPLAVPNLWYQAALKYDDVYMTGITLPGLPMIIAGSNGTIAWGFTNAQADVVDLVELTINPDNDRQYKTRKGWRDFKIGTETIKVKGQKDHLVKTRWSEWGPVSPRLLAGKEVAVQWSIFYPGAVDMTLLDMNETREIDAALKLFKNAGLPALNVMLADDQGHIAWTLTGKIPKRVGFNGSTSLNRDRGNSVWAGFRAADSYPEIIDPASGFLVTANNRVLPRQHEFIYGQNFANAYRAFRISEVLSAKTNLTSAGLFALQLDTRSGLYDFYQSLALSVLTEQAVASNSQLAAIKGALENWDGYANADSTGFGLLVKFRQRLADVVFSAYVQKCSEIDNSFEYTWFQMDTPLKLLLSHQLPETLPGQGQYRTWNDLITDSLIQVAKNTKRRFPRVSLAELKWGDMVKVQLKHPFSHAYPWLGSLLDMPEKPLSGCTHCVRVATRNFGASMRLIISPGHEDEMILVEPTGQSGHPLSPHFRDKYHYWVNGLPISMDTGTERLELLPEISGQHR